MKALLFTPLVLAWMFLSGCATTEERFAETPAGSVVTGRTTSTDEYIQKVRQQNETRTNQDAWRPAGRDQ